MFEQRSYYTLKNKSKRKKNEDPRKLVIVLLTKFKSKRLTEVCIRYSLWVIVLQGVEIIFEVEPVI